MTRCHEPALLLFFEINSIEIFIKREARTMKLFISADIEGCAGTTLNYETHKEEPAYQKYAKQMTDEVVAVCEAALAAGVDEIVVKDDTEMPPTLM